MTPRPAGERSGVGWKIFAGLGGLVALLTLACGVFTTWADSRYPTKAEARTIAATTCDDTCMAKANGEALERQQQAIQLEVKERLGRLEEGQGELKTQVREMRDDQRKLLEALLRRGGVRERPTGGGEP